MRHLKPFVLGLSVILGFTLCAVCAVGYFFFVARRHTHGEENEWYVVDPDNIPEVTVVPPGREDPFLRATPNGRFSQYSLSEFPPDVHFTKEQVASMRSFYRYKHNAGWLQGSFWRYY